jgi:hypothetical protein
LWKERRRMKREGREEEEEVGNDGGNSLVVQSVNAECSFSFVNGRSQSKYWPGAKISLLQIFADSFTGHAPLLAHPFKLLFIFHSTVQNYTTYDDRKTLLNDSRINQ